jgi:NADPH:quinone reductase-like Zn-dependent oxidoreductase
MVFARHGGLETLALAEVAKPTPGPRQLLVRVHATSVNPVDWKLHTGAYRFIVPGPLARMHGFDVAGVVEAVGPEISAEHVGRAVWAMIGTRFASANAEYALVNDRWAAPKPEQLSFEQAAAIPLAGLTALQSLRDQTRLAAGEELLVNGASGGVGLFALQIGKAMGARVTAVASSRNSELLREHGADRVVAYDKLGDKGIEGRFDVLCDAVATLSVWSARSLLTPTGRFVSTLPDVAFVLTSSPVRCSRSAAAAGARIPAWSAPPAPISSISASWLRPTSCASISTGSSRSRSWPQRKRTAGRGGCGGRSSSRCEVVARARRPSTLPAPRIGRARS